MSLFFVWSAQRAPLPGTGLAAAFLFLAVENDVRSLRIPNWLTFGGLGLVLGWAGYEGGLHAVGVALAGAGFALAVLFLPFHLGWLGAGDVKAMMVLGALWRGENVLPTLFWILVVGGLLAIALIIARRELGDLLRRWGRTAWVTWKTRQVTYFPPAAGSAAGSGLPFAVAIGIGAAMHQLWGSPWT